MDRRSTGLSKSPVEPNKIYVALIGSAPMASLDALLISLERFKNMLTSDSARDCFETAMRSIQPSLLGVNAFIDTVYAEKNPSLSVNSKNFTLVVEVGLTKKDFLECIHDFDADEILSHVTAVGTMSPKRAVPHQPRAYTVFPVKYVNGKFVK
jgi:hypothetical protein